jgi:hypothetical protein
MLRKPPSWNCFLKVLPQRFFVECGPANYTLWPSIAARGDAKLETGCFSTDSSITPLPPRGRPDTSTNLLAIAAIARWCESLSVFAFATFVTHASCESVMLAFE